MTGFGEAHRQQAALAVAVEVRTINSKYFKLTVRSGEGYSMLEPQIEAVVRNHIKRGTVQVSLRVNRARHTDDYRLNTVALASYREQVETLRHSWRLPEPVGLAALLLLPGVVDETRAEAAEVDQEWPLIEETLQAALESMAHMRIEEGRAMRADLAANCATMARELDGIEVRAPLVAEGYRARLAERLSKAFAEQQVTLDPADMVREVCVFAERSDISEETVRLRSHLEQFAAIMDHEDSSGRKLEFLTQEMFRETNTIGSKANDVQIAMHVIEIKTAIERIREMIQNVE
jgi:uncharacterized protein (TIGR00255 family)